MAPFEPKPPDPHHLAPPFIPCCLFCSSPSDYSRNSSKIHAQNPCLDSGRRDIGNRMEPWVFVAAQFHGDSGMEMLESTISSLESTSSVAVIVIGKLKDKKLRSVADNGDMKRTEA